MNRSSNSQEFREFADIPFANMQECREYAEGKGGQCLSLEYNYFAPMQWRCNRWHVWEAKFSTMKRNDLWCRTCPWKTEVTSGRVTALVTTYPHNPPPHEVSLRLCDQSQRWWKSDFHIMDNKTASELVNDVISVCHESKVYQPRRDQNFTIRRIQKAFMELNRVVSNSYSLCTDETDVESRALRLRVARYQSHDIDEHEVIIAMLLRGYMIRFTLGYSKSCKFNAKLAIDQAMIDDEHAKRKALREFGDVVMEEKRRNSVIDAALGIETATTTKEDVAVKKRRKNKENAHQ